MWDYWHVPGQYTLLRTPAADYFPEETFAQLEGQLLRFGQERLGCGNISPVWLSCYVSGCRQEAHADLPHGPWAFVLSLTPSPRRFSGGETFILKPKVLDYWCAPRRAPRGSTHLAPPALAGSAAAAAAVVTPRRLPRRRDFSLGRVVEAGQLMDFVAPEFNRLTVFDSRYPHGVRRPPAATRRPPARPPCRRPPTPANPPAQVRVVEGTHDPREGRLVLHGWFLEPTPFFAGALSEEEATEALNECLGPLYERLGELPAARRRPSPSLASCGARLLPCSFPEGAGAPHRRVEDPVQRSHLAGGGDGDGGPGREPRRHPGAAAVAVGHAGGAPGERRRGGGGGGPRGGAGGHPPDHKRGFRGAPAGARGGEKLHHAAARLRAGVVRRSPAAAGAEGARQRWSPVRGSGQNGRPKSLRRRFPPLAEALRLDRIAS